VPSIESIGLPPIFKEIAKEKTGLVLLTGATGSGKTTTLAALLNEINETQSVHIVTLEDPIEFVHPKLRATFNQRELGHDFNNYPNGLRAALRQAPKVILVGEMRDRATVEVALMAAETGHLVLSTLHTVDAGQAINRILGLFSLGEEQQLRIRLADTLRYIVSQRLAPKVNGGRQLLTEILGHNLRTKETIALGEGEHRSFYEIIEASSPVRLDDVRPIDPQRLRGRVDRRRNRESFRLPQGQGDPRHRPHPEGARRRQRSRLRPPPRYAGKRIPLTHPHVPGPRYFILRHR
jgi:twitching motility protein PilT